MPMPANNLQQSVSLLHWWQIHKIGERHEGASHLDVSKTRTWYHTTSAATTAQWAGHR